MQAEIHPPYQTVKVTCSCGAIYHVGSTLEQDKLSIEVCANCHPFYTGEQRLMDTAGRLESFQKRYGIKSKTQNESSEISSGSQ